MDFVELLQRRSVKVNLKMRNFILTLVFMAILLGGVSCKKCRQCSFTTNSGTTYLSERNCGSKKDRTSLEESWESRANDSLVPVYCTEKNQ